MMSERFPFETDEYTLHDYQRASVHVAESLGQTHKMPRLCLYYKTGAGKTVTALACIRVMGRTEVLVVAPPTTHVLWEKIAAAYGMTVTCMSHAKFRQRETKLSKTTAVIIDEVHMLGGYKAKGFKKAESLAIKLQAPMVIASATPNYNDVERCYIIQRLTDKRATEGGYLAFLYKHCNLDVNPWGHIPRVTGFTHYPDAASFLADLKHVEYIEDDLVYGIDDYPVLISVPQEMLTMGIDRRKERVYASAIERRHSMTEHMLIGDNGELDPDVWSILEDVIVHATTPVLVFAVHRTVAEVAHRTLENYGITSEVVHGKLTKPAKQSIIDAFKGGQIQVLVGTVTLATGTDGLDKMCDTMVILDDTDDNAMRRQLIGRIMPRGHAADTAHSNRVIRIIPSPSASP